MKDQKLIQVFVGSPADVADERRRAFDVIERVNNDALLPAGWRFQGIGWDQTHYPKIAWLSPQEAITQGIPLPGDCEIAVFIFWKRVGTRLPPATFAKNGAGPEPTGSLWEFHNAIEPSKKPWVLVYRSKREIVLNENDFEDLDELSLQLNGVKAFFKGFQDAEDRYLADYYSYVETDEFFNHLEQDLKTYISRQTARDVVNHTISKGDAGKTASIPAGYLNRLKDYVARVELLGLDLNENITNSLPQVYVPAVTTKSTEQHESLEGTFESERHELILHRLGESSLCLRGDPGSGKSTFSQWVAYLVANGVVPAHQIPPPKELIERLPDTLVGRLPVLIRLRDFWAHMGCAPNQGDWVQSELEKAISSWLNDKSSFGLAAEIFEKNLADGKLLLLLDGVDEVPEEHTVDCGTIAPRHALLSGLADALPQWRQQGNRILLTSRPYGLRGVESDRLKLPEVSLLPLDDDRQQLFIERWYCAADHANWQHYAKGLAEELLDRKELDDLRCNPLLLTALCVKYKESKCLSTNIYNLYNSVVDQVLFNRFRASDSERTRVRWRLEAVALAMHYGIDEKSVRTSPLVSVDIDELDRILARYAEKNPNTEGGAAHVLMRRNELLERSGLLLRRGVGGAEFYHQDFRDYLAAERWAREERRFEMALQLHGANRDWCRMLGFLFAKTIESTGGIDTPLRALTVLKGKLSRAALNTNVAAALLMADCLEIAASKAGDGGLSEYWVQSLRQVCDDSLDVVTAAADRNFLLLTLGRLGWDDRRGVGLNKDSRPEVEWLPVPDNKALEFYIAKYPITQMQFQAFVDAEDGYANSRWWTGFKERKEQPSKPNWKEPNAPRTNVDWFEAIAFCRWLTQLDSIPKKGWKILLPTDEQWRRSYLGERTLNFPWKGETDPNRHANFKETQLNRTSSVGLFRCGEARSGAMDMAGNVLEWCLQKYDDKAARVGSIAIDASNDHRILRGGSWGLDKSSLLVDDPFRFGPGLRLEGFGFRVVCQP